MYSRTSNEWIRATAKLVFGAFLFLFVASFLALPCMQGDRGLLVTMTNPVSKSSGFARSAPASKALPRASLQGPLSMAALGAPLLATPLPRASALASSVQHASAWQASTALALTVPTQAQASTRTYFPPLSAAASCAEYKLFKPQMNLFKAFEVPAAEHPFRFAVVLAVMLGLPVLASVPQRAPERARPGWTRLRSLPFASSDPPRLPYFAALRDA